MDVLNASRRYKVPTLATRCHQFINDRLTDSDVCSLLDQCIVANETDLVNSCLAFIKHHTSAVIASQSFLESSPEVVLHILNLEETTATEIELFEACVAWARSRCAPGNRDDPDALRRHLEPMLPHIRFPSMSQEDFASRVVPLNILNDTDTCAVFKYFMCPVRPPKRFKSAVRPRPKGANISSKLQSNEAPPLPQPRQRVQNGDGSRETKANDTLDSQIYPNICAMKFDIDSTPCIPTAPVASIFYDNDY
jgi:hypothetical protein